MGLFVAAGLGVVAAPMVDAADPTLQLSPGRAVFWPGVHVEDAAVGDAATCTADSCPTYPLAVAGGAARLRVAIDHPVRSNTFTLEVLDPSGTVVGSDATNNQFASEVLVPNPVGGKWTVRVIPTSVTNSGFRMRAKLERAVPQRPAGKVAMLPNLRTVPPYEFGFIAPANPLNAVYPPDTVNPPLDVAGVHPVSCAADETAPALAGGGGATKCLRLTSGPMNVGAGAFDLRFDFASDTVAGKVDPMMLQGPARQVVHFSDGSLSERPAGTFSFHKTHAHFHTDQILSYDLYKVDDPATGTMRAVGEGTKSGFCPADQLFGDWNSFTQLPDGTFGEGDSATGSCFSPDGGQIGLSVGWGDVYRWQRPGQYVEFGGQSDGLYVVRTTADKFNHILEEDETDNTSYGFVSIEGEAITILERGHGSDPWDPSKLVFTGDGPAARDLAAPHPVYLEEAPSVESGGAQVSGVVLPQGELPRTGAGPGALLLVLVAATGSVLALRRQLLLAPARDR